MDQYKVVKIIDENRIVINAGASDGFKSGSKFEIFVKGDMVIDPDTKEELGTLDFIKAKIEIETLYLNMSVCVNVKKVDNNPMATALTTLSNRALSVYGYGEKVPDELDVDMSEATGGLAKYNSKIKIGDLVKESLG